MSKSAAFSFAVVLSLALGIGGNAAVFSLINGLLLHPVGIDRPEGLVAPRVNYQKLGLHNIGVSAPDFLDVRNNTGTFSQAALADTGSFTYTDGQTPLRIEGALVSAQWFDVFRSKPLLGRAFLAQEDQPGANQVVVLSYRLWKKMFAGDRSVLGRPITLNQKIYRVVGVMPSGFSWPVEADLWTPIALAPDAFAPNARFNERYFAIARLAPGITYAQAARSMETLTRGVRAQVPFSRDSEWSMAVQPFTEYISGNLKTPVFLLLGAVALVLLVACSNVAGLLLVRATAFARERAIRVALGATRSDLLVGALTETFLLALAGTLLGLAMAYLLLHLLLTLAHTQVSLDLPIAVDRYVLLFTVAIGFASALLFGLAPALHIARGGRQPQIDLKEGSRSDTEGASRHRLRSWLVAGQIALASVLLIGSGLLLKTLANMQNASTGFHSAHVMTSSVSLPASAYKDDAAIASFYRRFVDGLSQQPGVTSAAAVNALPFSGADPTASFSIEGRIVGPGDPGSHGGYRAATPGYFEAMRIPLLAGRLFDGHDRVGAAPVVVIDSALARRYWGNENPIGHRLRNGRNQPWTTIVGVVGSVKQTSLTADAGRGVYYYPLYQQPKVEAFLVARGNLRPQELGNDMRQVLHSVDSSQALFDFKTMDERVLSALGPQRFVTKILLGFAAVALLLAALGMYGVVSYSVARRTREIGIRVALGAERSRILSLVLRQTGSLLAAGLLAGFIAAVLVGRALSAQLFQVRPWDPLTFVVAFIVLTVSALLATAVPAWRATRVDPIVALRNE